MNKRRLLIIIAALAAGAVAWAIIAQYSAGKLKNHAGIPGAPFPYPKLEQVRARIKADMDHLATISPEQWADMRKRNPALPATGEDMRQRMAARLAQLDAMTPEQWDAQQQEMMAKRSQRFPFPMPQAPNPQSVAPQPAPPQPAGR